MTQMELYHRIFLVALVLTIIFFVLTVVLFFVFDIANIIGNKTGHIQKKSVQNMRKGKSRESVRKTKKHIAEAEVLSSGTAETEKLETIGEMTTVLQQNTSGVTFVILSEIMEVHSQEMIS